MTSAYSDGRKSGLSRSIGGMTREEWQAMGQRHAYRQYDSESARAVAARAEFVRGWMSAYTAR
ncbi:MAG TPA: hypothetical protein VNG51_00415 [Ktedonobacteraceae bacterium]|nr:hypothetical protein [Ktedonobacteraceae bacterium]